MNEDGRKAKHVEKLLEDVRSNIEREAKARALARTKTSVMDALAAACTFDVPKALVEEVIEKAETAIGTENKVRTAILAGVDPQEAYLKYGKF